MIRALAFATLAATGAQAIVGDEVPNPPAVLNVLLEEPSYGYAEAVRAGHYKANEAKLAALQTMAGAAKGSIANLIRANSAKFSKASYLQEQQPQLDSSAIQQIEAKLAQDCGKSCTDFFHQYLSKMEGKSSKDWSPALVDMMTNEYNRVQSMYKQNLETTKLAQSFVKSKAKFNLVDVPCGDATSCKLVEVIANKCDYARVGTLATYNAVNLAAHVFAVVMNVLCGCIHVGPISHCIVPNTSLAPICEFPSQTYEAMMKASRQTWESGVKGTTKACNMIGDFRVAAPLP